MIRYYRTRKKTVDASSLSAILSQSNNSYFLDTILRKDLHMRSYVWTELPFLLAVSLLHLLHLIQLLFLQDDFLGMEFMAVVTISSVRTTNCARDEDTRPALSRGMKVVSLRGSTPTTLIWFGWLSLDRSNAWGIYCILSLEIRHV